MRRCHHIRRLYINGGTLHPSKEPSNSCSNRNGKLTQVCWLPLHTAMGEINSRAIIKNICSIQIDSTIQSEENFANISVWVCSLHTSKPMNYHNYEFSIFYSRQRIIVHPDYNATSITNDIALIQLEYALVFNSRVQPACLWPYTREFGNGTEMMVAGWGVTEANGEY